MTNITDDKGYNQIWRESKSTDIRAERRCDGIIEQLNGAVSKTAVEIGCGNGKNAYTIARKTGYQVLGTDICAPFIEEAKQRYTLPNLEYKLMDFNNPQGIAGRSFGYVFGNGILHHLYYDLDTSLVNMKQLLEPGGKLIFMEPNIYNPYCQLIFKVPFLRKWAKLEPDEMAFSSSFIKKKLVKAGYKNISVTYKDFLLPGIPDFLIKPSIAIGNIAEKIPLVKNIAQSIFIVAEK